MSRHVRGNGPSSLIPSQLIDLVVLILVAGQAAALPPARKTAKLQVKEAHIFSKRDHAAAAAACDGTSLREKYGQSFLDCRCPNESTVGKRSNRKRDAQVTKIFYGMFSKHLPQSLVRIDMCEGPHDGGLVLLSQIDGKWRREAYVRGFAPDECVDLRRADGLDSLACIASDQAMGCLGQWIEVARISEENELNSKKIVGAEFSSSAGSDTCGDGRLSSARNIALGPGHGEFTVSVAFEPDSSSSAGPIDKLHDPEEETYRFRLLGDGTAERTK